MKPICLLTTDMYIYLLYTCLHQSRPMMSQGSGNDVRQSCCVFFSLLISNSLKDPSYKYCIMSPRNDCNL